MRTSWFLFAGLFCAACAQTAPGPQTAGAGAASGATTAPPPPTAVLDQVQPAQYRVTLSTDPAAQTSVMTVRDVALTLHVKNAPASNNVAVEFTGPGGAVYQRQVGAVADSRLSEQTVTFTLPVAGTFISLNSLTGTWRANIYVDGQERAAQPFDLTP